MAEPLAAALIGFVGGVSGAVLTDAVKTALAERLKDDVAKLEAELTRLDSLHDQLLLVFDIPPGAERTPTLRAVNSLRQRIGINLRALVLEENAWAQVSAGLSLLDGTVRSAEDGETLSPEARSELDSNIRRLRRVVRNRSTKRRAFFALRGG